MRDRRLTTAAVSFRAGLHPDAVSKLLRNEREPAFLTACRLADALGVDVGELRVWPGLTGDKPHPPKKRPKPE
jgi:transcriptional regulator with XRE-family HTH domain